MTLPRRPGDIIGETQRLYRELFGQEAQLVNDFGMAFQALVEGVNDIVVELPWEEDQFGEKVSRHQIVLKQLLDDNTRVQFFNPAARNAAPGTELGNQPDEGPKRRVEATGVESMELSQLARYFAEGKAMALVPPH
jgi:hypothetical protein